jgi:hypothetical protein
VDNGYVYSHWPSCDRWKLGLICALVSPIEYILYEMGLAILKYLNTYMYIFYRYWNTNG